MFSQSSLSSVFGACPAGATDRIPEVLRAGAKAGFGLVLDQQLSKTPLCPLTPTAAKRADAAAKREAAEAGHPRAERTRHACGIKHVFDASNVEKGVKAARDLITQREEINLGIEVGASRLVVVDMDTPEQRDAFLSDWTDHTNAEPPGYTVASPGVKRVAADGTEQWLHHGGGHCYFVVPEGISLPEGDGALTAEGGYSVLWRDRQVLLPPSRRLEGPYRLLGDSTELPGWLYALICSSAEQKAARRERAVDPVAVDDPIQQWANRVRWADLLTEDGWTDTGKQDTCSCPIFTAPGEHASEKSATAHEPGCYLFDVPSGGFLHLWTDHPPAALGDRTDVGKLNYVALTEHDGNAGAAMAALGIERRASGTDAHDPLIAAVRASQAEDEGTPGDGGDEAESGQSGGGNIPSEANWGDAGGDSRPFKYSGVLDRDYEWNFWKRREILRCVYEKVKRAHGNPWALLGAVLARAVSVIGPHVQLPSQDLSPTAGNTASLNLQIAMVGRSGGGKDRTLEYAKRVLDTGLDHLVAEPETGSGAGVAGAYLEKTKGSKRPVQVRDSVLFKASEVTSIYEQASAKQGSSGLLSELRKLWSGQKFEPSNFGDESKRKLAANSYRGVAIANVQPDISDGLLNEASNGTPQRWLWMPTDKTLATERLTDEEAEWLANQDAVTYGWKVPEHLRIRGEQSVVGAGGGSETGGDVPSAEAFLQDPVRVIRMDWSIRRELFDLEEMAEPDTLDWHRTLSKMKVAAVLALLENREDINLEDWELAEAVMQVSDATRAECERAVAKKAERRSRSAGRMRGIEQEEMTAHQHERRSEVEDRLLERLKDAGAEGMGKRALDRAVSSSRKSEVTPALGELEEQGLIEQFSHQPSGAGRPTTRFRVSGSGGGDGGG